MDDLGAYLNNLCYWPNSVILTRLIFDRISDDEILILVKTILNFPEHHVTLEKLNSSFDKFYWKRRIEKLQKSCYIFDHLKTQHFTLLSF